jgi:O-antigen/teichoic acid export membrane protein
LAWIALFQAVANFGLSELTMRELGRVDDSDGKYITHSLLIGACTSAVCMVLMAGIVPLFNYPDNMREALLLGVLLLAPLTASSICRAGFLAHGRPEFVFVVALVESLTAVSINCYLAIAGYGIVTFVATMLGVKVMTSLLSFRFLKKHVASLRSVLDAKFCRKLLSTLLTFALGGMLGTFSTRINLILLSVWATIPIVGLYAAASKVMELALIIPAIFAQTLLPRLSSSFAQHKTGEIRKYLASSLPWMLGAVVVLGGGVAVFAPLLLKVLFGPEFSEGSHILRILMLFVIIESVDTIMSVTLKAAGREKLDVRLFMGNVVANICASFFLIPAWGGLGCAVAKCVGGLASSVPRYAALVRLRFRLTGEKVQQWR